MLAHHPISSAEQAAAAHPTPSAKADLFLIIDKCLALSIMRSMPAAAPPISTADRDLLARLGEKLRRAREAQKVSAVSAAEAAGLSRPTLHRIERGEPGVAMGSWVALASALGLQLDAIDPRAAAAPAPLPERIRLDDFPQLKQLAWQLPGVEDVSPKEALDLYERNWRHVDVARLTSAERVLLRTLAQAFGAGRLLV